MTLNPYQRTAILIVIGICVVVFPVFKGNRANTRYYGANATRNEPGPRLD